MPHPTLSDVHVSTPLTNLSVAYVLSQDKFVADKVSPIVPVAKQANTYFVFDKADFMRDGATVRSPGAGFSRIGYRISTDTYAAVQYAVEYVLPDEVRENFDSPLSADKAAVKFITQQMMIRRERYFASRFLAASVWSADIAGHASNDDSDEHIFWDNSSADIIKTIWRFADQVEESTGHRPNRFITNPEVARVMLNNSSIVDRHKYTSSEPISLKAVANICGLGTESDPGEIVVMRAPYNTAVEGASASMDWMIGDVGLLAYVAPSPQIDQPSACYTFSWSPFDMAKNGAAAIETYRDEPHRSDVYRGMIYMDMKRTSTDCGIYFSNLLT